MTLMKLEIGSSESILQPQPQGYLNSVFEPVTPERCSLSEITPPRQFCSPSLDDSLYDIPPPPKPINQSSLRMNSMSSLTSSHSQDSCFDQTSCGSCSPSKCDPSESSVFENNIYQYVESDSLYYEIPPPPSFFSTKRFSDPLQQCPHYETIYGRDCKKEVSFDLFDNTEVSSSKHSSTFTLKSNYIPMLPVSSSGNRPQPPAKPPRKSVSPLSADAKSSSSQRNSCESICFATSEIQKRPKKICDQNENNQAGLNCFKSVDPSEYVDMSLVNRSIAAYENHDIICSNGLDVDKKHSAVKNIMCSDITSGKSSDVLPLTFICEDVHRKAGSFNNLMPSKSTPALHASKHTLDQALKEFQQQKPINANVKKRASTQLPISPTGYQQPPTPDNPPPSPGTAEIGIHEKIHPVQAPKKLSSRDIDTLTDEQLVATIGPHGEFELTLATDNKCISTENDCSPFAGLHHGSVSATRGEKLSKSRTIYENVQIAMEEDRNKIILSSECSDMKENNCGCLSVMSPFDEKAEWAEIADIMASFGGSITRESRFVESHFAQAFKSEPRPNQQCFSCVEQWLSHIGLSKYENVLIINGFDDVNFLGGNIIEDADLIEIGVQNEKDRNKLCAFAQKLPSVIPLSKMRENGSFPQSVDEWLNSINLLEYSDNFANNNITDMERALKLWEVELNTVLKISKIGHRKRILASLGDKHFDEVIGTNELDISKLTLDLAELDVVDNVNKKYNMLKGSREIVDDSTPDSSSKLYLRIRSPTQLMSDSQYPEMGAQQSNIKAQWCHRPDELVKYSFNYIAKYLGSTLVKELHGLESTRNSIQKLKSSTKDIAKIPDILLSISYSGVKFIDNKTRQLVCEHEIRNIHCACQDADDLHHFAYITKEHQTHNHYCHVFSSYTVDLASEIILTLGQAFEVAYQIAMKEKAERTWNSDSKNSQVAKDLS
ncbi:ankyrin repeat and sterile alpha motif domain-containing protein 1B-like [Uloborus diversus]|uniref:ankyrin repeat and sterile alpha motif domain-containing protein 1B-like n=1 Tax=Uloborus diversus TaxID=327109 RepID=UPI0024097557|nr:ankyrin repeat and sterile alpha motif domain-containing protein 1B-like [Uloborus diversus]